MPNKPQTLLHPADSVVLRHPNGRGWLSFTNPLVVLQTNQRHEVLPILAEVERLTQQQGLYAAGFISYEAAGAMDPALQTKEPGTLPLIWFALYKAPVEITSWPEPSELVPTDTTAWLPEISATEYGKAISRIRDYIAHGDTYQVNYTFRLRGVCHDNPACFFARLCAIQPTPFNALIRAGSHVICSASPELFFDLAGSTITCRPMKGTRARGLHISEDRLLGEQLFAARKDRAENLMIVDMMRNDLGRIAAPGTVRVHSLFDVERHPTVWQMTSTIQAATRAPLVDILRALFPCASVTGAPKVRTMQIIAELEKSPRGIYTGAIGFLAPWRRARFSVAIRTLCVHETLTTAEYGVGSGVLWDSASETEYAECLTKARILRERPPGFDLLETLLWEPHRGFRFEDLHLQRMADSAEYFGYPFDRGALLCTLGRIANEFHHKPQRVRLRLARDGSIYAERAPAMHSFGETPDAAAGTFCVVLAGSPVSSNNPLLYHKTTNREVYEKARREIGTAADDVILWNERGEVTESSMANVVVAIAGEWITPPVRCGLLPGVYRQHLLKTDRIREQVINISDFYHADAVYLINSVRGWVRCEIMRPPGQP